MKSPGSGISLVWPTPIQEWANTLLSSNRCTSGSLRTRMDTSRPSRSTSSLRGVPSERTGPCRLASSLSVSTSAPFCGPMRIGERRGDLGEPRGDFERELVDGSKDRVVFETTEPSEEEDVIDSEISDEPELLGTGGGGPEDPRFGQSLGGERIGTSRAGPVWAGRCSQGTLEER